MRALYAHALAGGDGAHFIETLLRPELESDPVVFDFARTLFLRTLDRTDDADAIIGKHAENWDLGRIAIIDRVVLRMAVCELMAFEDIPPKVSIDEAIEIAKRYSTDKSGSFINGVLDAVLHDLSEQGRLKKSGRGLVGMDSLRTS